MHDFMNPHKRREIAIWRMRSLGRWSARVLNTATRAGAAQIAASRTYETPSGRRVRYEWRTLEGWYYQYKHGGLGARAAAAEGHGHLPGDPRGGGEAHPGAAPGGAAAQRPGAHPRGRAGEARRVRRTLAKSSVVRLLRAHGLSQRPRATPERERRAFTVELPGDLWMGDAMHGPPVIDARRRAAQEGVPADADRRRVALPHQQRLLPPRGRRVPGGRLRRAITGHGLPREYYVDGGCGLHRAIRCGRSAPSSVSTCSTLARGRPLRRVSSSGITKCGAPRSASSCRARRCRSASCVSAQAAWLTCEYNRRVHGMTKQRRSSTSCRLRQPATCPPGHLLRGHLSPPRVPQGPQATAPSAGAATSRGPRRVRRRDRRAALRAAAARAAADAVRRRRVRLRRPPARPPRQQQAPAPRAAAARARRRSARSRARSTTSPTSTASSSPLRGRRRPASTTTEEDDT
jgi:hypothetical protein